LKIIEMEHNPRLLQATYRVLVRKPAADLLRFAIVVLSGALKRQF
jgi:hypothetical protein